MNAGIGIPRTSDQSRGCPSVVSNPIASETAIVTKLTPKTKRIRAMFFDQPREIFNFPDCFNATIGADIEKTNPIAAIITSIA